MTVPCACYVILSTHNNCFQKCLMMWYLFLWVNIIIESWQPIHLLYRAFLKVYLNCELYFVSLVNFMVMLEVLWLWSLYFLDGEDKHLLHGLSFYWVVITRSAFEYLKIQPKFWVLTIVSYIFIFGR